MVYELTTYNLLSSLQNPPTLSSACARGSSCGCVFPLSHPSFGLTPMSGELGITILNRFVYVLWGRGLGIPILNRFVCVLWGRGFPFPNPSPGPSRCVCGVCVWGGVWPPPGGSRTHVFLEPPPNPGFADFGIKKLVKMEAEIEPNR